jgi:hypothetical protein
MSDACKIHTGIRSLLRHVDANPGPAKARRPLCLREHNQPGPWPLVFIHLSRPNLKFFLSGCLQHLTQPSHSNWSNDVDRSITDLPPHLTLPLPQFPS